MAKKDQVSGKWKSDIRPNGRDGKRYRGTFKTKHEALRWEAWIRSNIAQNPEWEPPKKDKKRLAECIDIWYDLHGQYLKDGKGRKGTLYKICEGLGNPIASQVKPEDYAAYRAAISDTVSESTLNHHLAYLKAVYNELVRHKVLTENPIKDVKKIRVDEPELTYLELEEISRLISSLHERKNEDTLLVTKLCLATGARWSEAEQIDRKNVRKYSVTFTKTKSKKNRTVPIDPDLYTEIMKGQGQNGRLFQNCYQSFENGLNESGIVLPKGQRTHVLRHTFASHFMMNGGNILTLQKILGHASINMTMKYAHLSPDHLIEAANLNPLKRGHFVDS